MSNRKSGEMRKDVSCPWSVAGKKRGRTCVVRSQLLEKNEEGRQWSVVRGQLRERSKASRSRSVVRPHSSKPFPAHPHWLRFFEGWKWTAGG